MPTEKDAHNAVSLDPLVPRRPCGRPLAVVPNDEAVDAEPMNDEQDQEPAPNGDPADDE